MARVARSLRIHGRVQGVGFRPWAARTAERLQLGGSVRNLASGVRVELEGERRDIELWLQALRERFGAQLEQLHVTDAPIGARAAFRIEASDPERAAGVPRIPFDLATCEACVEEVFDPSSRRHRYAFTHCARCGPRASVVQALPYDRERTTLSRFAPCASCLGEYATASDRRFHAQTLACPDCGPRVLAYDPITGATRAVGDAAVEAAAAALVAGQIVAIKGYGGFHLLCDATRAPAVQCLRARKGRPRKPFAVMVADAAHARRCVELDSESEAWLCSAVRAVVLAPRCEQRALHIADEVAPDSCDLGLILPVSPLHWLLLYGPDMAPRSHAPRFAALVFTSANRSDEPTLHANGAARRCLVGLADLVLEHDREVARRSDDPVVRSSAVGMIPLRSSRGTSPQVHRLPVELRATPPLLALGGDLKCAPALLTDGELLLAEHVGDLGSVEATDALVACIDDLCRHAGVRPEVIACDLHPDYHSHGLARRWGVRVMRVQHQHAHARGCLADRGIAPPALAWVLDGAGFGPDGSVWGGELLHVTRTRVERLAHLESVRLAGGDAAVREPWRMAAVWLRRAFPEGAPEVPWLQHRSRAVLEQVVKLAERGLHSPLTTSCGRLFDAVASLLGLGDVVTHEAELALALESLASNARFGFPLSKGGDHECLRASPSGTLEIPLADLVRALVLEHARGAPAAPLARALHEVLAERCVAAAARFARRLGVVHVALSGGCLQNRLLCELLSYGLRARGLEPILHRSVPPNDGGLALGQALVAAERLAAERAHRSDA